MCPLPWPDLGVRRYTSRRVGFKHGDATLHGENGGRACLTLCTDLRWSLTSSLMVKRKAEGVQRRGKAPARPPPTRQPPPPAQDDDSSDSDVCEIVSPPASTNRQPRRRPPPQPPASSLNFSSASSSQTQARSPAGLLSMMPAGFGLAPPGGAGFGFPQQAAFARVQASSGYNSILCDPRLLPSPAGLQRGYMGGFPMSPAGGASSRGSSSGSTPVGEIAFLLFSKP